MYSGWDIGIYARALHQMGNDFILNPYIEIINKGIFNDHLDPIILLAAPLTRIFPANYVAYFVMALSIIFALILFSRFAIKEQTNPLVVLVCISYMLLNDGIVKAIIYPPHPTTWAILPIFFLCFYIYREKNLPAFISFLALCFYKESFPFIGIPLCLVFYHRKNKKLAFGTILISLLLIFFHKLYWHQIVGPISDFGGRLIQQLFNDPKTLLSNALSKSNIKMIFYLFGPVLISAFAIRRFNPVFLFISSPLFAMQLLSGKWHLHYSASISLFIIFSLFSKKEIKPIKNFNSKILLIPLLFTLSHGAGPGIQAIKVIKKEVSLQLDLKNSFNNVLKIIPREKKLSLLVTGSFIPHLYHYRTYGFSHNMQDTKIHDYVIIHKNGGDWFPVEPHDRERIIKNLNFLKNNILYEDKNIGLLKGPLSEKHFIVNY